MSYYRYYDSPEGEDVFKKIWVTSKYAGATGFIVATGDVMLYSHPKGYLRAIGYYAYYMGPFVAMAATFTATSNLLVSIRKKNDKLNYFIGGVVAGSIMGTWRKSLMVGFLSSLAFGVFGMVKKDFIDHDWRFVPDIPVAGMAGVNADAHDYTLTKQRPGNWVTGNEQRDKNN